MTVADTAESAKTQLELLRKKLLDLSLHNRMLNYRPSKRLGIAVIGEDSFYVHKLLVEEGKRFTFTGKPDPLKKDADPRQPMLGEDEVAMAEFQRAAEEELYAFLENAAMPVDQLDTKLSTEEFESILQAKLRTVMREAGLANEELGINTLFLTLGTLEWSETDQRSFRAPLLYVPVKLEQPKNGSLRLVHDGSDVGTNLPLRAKLAEFNLKLPELEDNKTLLDYFSEVESTVRSRATWRVHRDEICLGFFNYEKYAMYVDLGGENWPEGHKPWQRPDIKAMLGGNYANVDSPIDEDTNLDPIRPVAQCHEVFDADSSQTLAMIRAAAGLSIVVEGPPGTGKSQTITNIIAEAVAAGKTVLFVSAKRAALEVVRRNLDRADLGSMCLDLHDKLTNRREFYSEIKRTVNKSLKLRSEEEKVARLTELRSKLNAYSCAVNEPIDRFGVTPFDAMGELARLNHEQPEDREARIPFEKLSHWQSMDIRKALPVIRALQERVHATGKPRMHPFWGCSIDYLDPARRLDIEQDLGMASSALSEAITVISQVAQTLRVEGELSPERTSILRVCAERAIGAPPHDGVAITTVSWKQEQPTVRTTIEALRARRRIRSERETQVKPEIWTADLLQVEYGYERFATCWYRFLARPFRNAQSALTPYLTSSAPNDAVEVGRLVANVREVQAAEATVVEQAPTMQRLFGVQWHGLETDPQVLERLLDWVLQLHTEVEAKLVPPGLLDFFAGTPDDLSLLPLVDEAEEKAQVAMSAYVESAKDLCFPADGATQETWSAISQRVTSWKAHLGRLHEFISYNEARRQVIEKDLACVVDVADSWGLAAVRLTETFLRSYYSGVVRHAMEVRPELKTFERAAHEAAIQEFQSLDDFKLAYNRAQVRLAHHRQLPTFDNALGNLGLLKVQCELQRQHKPIRWIMSRAGEALQRIKPVFMMSPLSVAIHLPPELPQFDMVIFDEASQIKPEDAMCAVARARQCIVVGDTRQMPPTSFFDRLAGDDDIEDEEEAAAEFGREAAKLESVLSLMSAVTEGKTRRPDLRWHYRSVHPSLIQPSNEMFYDNRLIVFPSPDVEQSGRRIGVVFHHHPETVYEAGSKYRINRREAEIVADAVAKHVEENGDESLLVAAMNKPQADLIYDEVQKRERLNPVPFNAYRETHPHEPVAIKNLENVQGDERDVVFISVTYGRDATGTLRQHFGPLLRDGGERRLNVLISRARRRCEVFTNITADDIRLDSPRLGVHSLKRYLRFAETGVLDVATPTGDSVGSPFEEEVAMALRNHGYDLDLQVGCDGFRIDLAVIDPRKPGRYLVGVECDGATYHSARSARDRDKLRQRILESRGWTIRRIWSHDWWQDREGEIERLVAVVEAARCDQPDEIQTKGPTRHYAFIEEEERGPHSVTRTRPYVACQPLAGPPTQEALAGYMLELVSVEGPIHEGLLVARLRDAAGFGRAGSNVRYWLDTIIDGNRHRVTHWADAFYSEDVHLRQPRDWSTRPSSEKKTDFVPEVEVAAALRAVIGTSFGISDEAAAKGAFNLMGFKRLSDAALDKATLVISKMLNAGGLVRSPDGLLMLPRSNHELQ